MKKHLIAAAVTAAHGDGRLGQRRLLYRAGQRRANDAAVRAAGGRVTNRLPAVNAVVAEVAAAMPSRRRSGRLRACSRWCPTWSSTGTGGCSVRSRRCAIANPPTSGDDCSVRPAVGHTTQSTRSRRGTRATEARARGSPCWTVGSIRRILHIAPNFDAGCSADFTGEGLEYGPNVDDPSGIFSHGMHVAGTIAADNGVGVIVAPEARACLVKVLFNYGSGSFEDVAEGIVWAADQGVDVIQHEPGRRTVQGGRPG